MYVLLEIYLYTHKKSYKLIKLLFQINEKIKMKQRMDVEKYTLIQLSCANILH